MLVGCARPFVQSVSPRLDATDSAVIACLAMLACVQACARIYPRLLVFGLGASMEELPLEGDLQISLAKSFYFFQELLAFLSQLRATLKNLVLQLQGIYGGDKSKAYASFATVHLPTAWLALAQGFGILVTIDHIVTQNGAVGHSYALFNRYAIPASCSFYSHTMEDFKILATSVTRTVLEFNTECCMRSGVTLPSLT